MSEDTLRESLQNLLNAIRKSGWHDVEKKVLDDAEAALRAETPCEPQTARVMDVHGAASETGDSQAGYPEAGSIPVGAVNILETRDFLLRELVTEWRYLAGEGERFDKDPVRRFRRDKDANYLVRESKRLRQCALQVEDILLKSAAGELEQAK